MKRHIDQLRQIVHYSPESTSNSIDNYYYSYEPVTSVQDGDSVLRTPPTLLEEERYYPQRQYRPPDRFIHGDY